MVSPIGRTKGFTARGKGNVVLVAAQLDDADGNPTEEYVLLRADEFGRLRTVGGGVSISTFLALTDTPVDYVGAALQGVRVNAAEDALEFAAVTSHSPMFPEMDDLGAGETWGLPGWGFGQISSGALTAEQLRYVPIYVERSRLFTAIGCHVTIAGAGGTVARLGIYAGIFNGAGELTPGALTLDAGTVAVDSTGEKAISIAQTLAEGFHFLAISSDGTPTMARPNNNGAVWSPVTARRTSINGTPFGPLTAVVADGAAALPDPAAAPTLAESVGSIFVFIGDIP